MRVLKLCAVMTFACAMALAQTPGATPSDTTPKSTGTSVPGFDINALDRTADPCVDFYKFACGNWQKNNPLPADKARYGRFDELAERNRATLRDILEGVAKKPNRSPIEKQVGDYYAACMDTASIDKLGAKPIQPMLEKVAAMKSKTDLIDTAAWLDDNGVPVLFGFGPGPDLHDANMTVANIIQGGFSLPDRDYYLKDGPRPGDTKYKETREKYLAHVQKMLELAGDQSAAATKEAEAVLRVETELARASMDRTLMRDPKNRDHKMPVADISKTAPNFAFDRYFAALHAPKFDQVNVIAPDFFEQVNKQIDTLPMDDWKAYYRWRVVRSHAMLLSDPFVQESFAFNGKYMNGQKELEPRWKRCVSSTDRALGEALGQLYVAKNFGPDGKQRTLDMVKAIEDAMDADLKTLDWMTPETKNKAYEKLNALRNHIGYPDKWRDYSSVVVKPGDALGNSLRAEAFESHRQLNKIGKPFDKEEWGMTPPTVNAYYRAAANDINFPAGILQPPFFDKSIDDAVNYGAMGVVVGHELTHGFDDQGAKFAADGNFTNWWSPTDEAEFNKRTGCLADEYTKFSPVEGVNLNGKLTLGENTADNGGARLAFMAMQKRLEGKPQQKLDGLTPEQRFFLGFAQIWCENVAPERSRVLALTDPHSPGQFRVKGVVVNNADFQKAYNCKTGQPMVSENACRVW